MMKNFNIRIKLLCLAPKPLRENEGSEHEKRKNEIGYWDETNLLGSLKVLAHFHVSTSLLNEDKVDERKRDDLIFKRKIIEW